MEVLLLGGAPEADDDLVKIADLGELADDLAHGRSLEFRVEGWQNEPDGEDAREALQFTFEAFNASGAEAVQGGDNSRLIEVSHEELLVSQCGERG